MLKAAIYDPYLDTLGGGERYVLTVAEILSNNGYQVDLFWSGNQDLLIKASARFNLDLSKVNFKADIFQARKDFPQILDNTLYYKIKNFINRYLHLSKYDLMFYLSDGSIPFLFSKKNLLHFQVPFVTYRKSLLTKIKLSLISQVVCNSQFTQSFINKNYSDKSIVLYPPVDIDKFHVAKKENIILTVGRFDNLLNAKKQDVLIEAFKKLYPSAKNWKLVLVGGSLQEPSQNKYLLHLQTIAKGFPIEFNINPDFDFLKDLYSHSSIYWHAAGFDVDQALHPESTEHFGMVVVEAMSSGLAPLVVDKGGLPEIINHGHNGFLWETTDNLIDQTMSLINNENLLKTISQNALDSSSQFSKQIFTHKLLNIIK